MKTVCLLQLNASLRYFCCMHLLVVVKMSSNDILKPRIHHHTAAVCNKGSSRSGNKAPVQTFYHSSLVIQLFHNDPSGAAHGFVHTRSVGLNDRLGRFKRKGKCPSQSGTNATLEKGTIKGSIDNVRNVSHRVIDQNKKGSRKTDSSI